MSTAQTLLFNDLRPLTENPILLIILVAIFSALGSFFGGYLKQSGQNKATEEGFERIRKQLLLTTQDTEEIKQQLSKSTWLTQQQWIAREKYYTELLSSLYRFKIALESLYDYYLKPGSEHIPDQEFGESFHAKKREAAEAYTNTEKLLGPATLYLSDEVAETLQKMFMKHWELTAFGAFSTLDYIENASVMAEDVYKCILKEARRQLSLAHDV